MALERYPDAIKIRLAETASFKVSPRLKDDLARRLKGQ
jgi:hypothetical protein